MFRPPHQVKRVLFPVCQDEHSEKAFDYYAKNLHDDRDPITFVNVVVPEMTYVDGRVPPISYEDITSVEAKKTDLKKTEKLLDKYLKKCEELKLNCSREMLMLKSKKISDEISSYAKDNADVVVMNTGKHSTFERIFLGSITYNTIQKAMVPVLVIPHVDEKKQ